MDIFDQYLDYNPAQYWEFWFYGGCILLTLTVALLSRDRKLELCAYYFAVEWVLGVLSTIIVGPILSAYPAIVLVSVFLYYFYRLADEYADWAGYVFLIQAFIFLFELLLIFFEEDFAAFQWLVNMAFLSQMIVVVAASLILIRARGK